MSQFLFLNHFFLLGTVLFFLFYFKNMFLLDAKQKKTLLTCHFWFAIFSHPFLSPSQELMGGAFQQDASVDLSRKAMRMEPVITRCQEGITAIERCRKPVVGAFHSGVIGAGWDGDGWMCMEIWRFSDFCEGKSYCSCTFSPSLTKNMHQQVQTSSDNEA